MRIEIKFGTDGWRGIIAQDFTFDNVRLCAQSVAEYLQDKGLARRGLVVGYDTRFASEHFAATASEVVAANGIKVYLCPKATPTPVISYGVLHQKAAGAIIITASHNPALWNGFKIKTKEGASAPLEVEAEIERRLPEIIAQDRVKHLPLNEGLSKGLIEYLDLDPAYFRQLAQLIDLESIRKAGLKIVVDSMFGAGAGYFKNLLESSKTEVVEINGERNPLFPGIQPEPIARHLSKLSTLVKESGAKVGLATDGDADRLGIVDERGNALTPLQIFALLALYLLEVRGERGAIVRTLTTTRMLDRLGELYHVPVYETPVGFKYIAPKMMAENALIGGEESSGFGFRGHLPERDGILAGIYFLDLMTKLNKTPSELIDYLYSKVGPHHYQRLDLEFPQSEREKIISRLTSKMPTRLAETKVIRVNTVDGFHFSLADGSWLLVRFSGTEPILRIYAEAPSLTRAGALIAEGRKILEI
ncbi:MAG TPA: phosphoglucomutase/phosphomannomutase family protein [Dehalococcoidia bacterium]|nr:phosphoglucomutase/phosphomannomutase family protein [Dehalococcoidia bacterium]